MTTDMLNIKKQMARDILKNDLGKRKISLCFMPHSLTPEQKQKIMNCCHDLIKFVEDDPDI
jgi:hypothetical protein